MLSVEVGLVDFPTLGDLQDAWIEQHCRVPATVRRGRPFRPYDWQFWCRANHYRVRPDAVFDPDDPPLNQAFVYRRSLIVGPQKLGKGPDAAATIALEAVGPSQFAGWAVDGDVYDCAEHGCGCGFVYDYEPGEPMGMRHPSPLIQLSATSQDQVDNVYRDALIPMIRLGPLKHLLLPRESFIRIVGGSGDDDLDRIDAVTSSAQSRLGQPISFALQDESGLYTDTNKMRNIAETQRRGAAGMGGRTMETTNCWDPAENSVAQSTYELNADDVFIFYRNPDLAPHLRTTDGKPYSFRDKRQRRKILEHVYAGSDHVNLDSIEAELKEIMVKDPAQAERFFGNRIVAGLGTWLPDGLWASREASVVVPDGASVAGGFDGSESGDWSALRLETKDGHRFTPTYGPDKRPTVWNPAEWGGQIPRGEVHAAMDEIVRRYKMTRVYCDPRGWQTEIADWALKYGEKMFVEWATYRISQMHAALERALTDLQTERSTHDSCQFANVSYANARKIAKPGDRYILGKPSDHQKIDVAMADVLAHEAWADVTEADEWPRKRYATAQFI